jgi:uncharacterized lipoprotein YehR (DUF1307 family)
MKTMRKIFVAASLAVVLFACGKNEQSNDNQANTPAEVAPDTLKPKTDTASVNANADTTKK